MKNTVKEYVDYCLNEYVTSNRQVGWVRKVCAEAGKIDDDAFDRNDVVAYCAEKFDMDGWFDNETISAVAERGDVKGLKNLVNKAMWFTARHYIDSINSKFRKRNTYNESQLSTAEYEFDISEVAVCYDIDEYEAYEKTELYKTVISPILDDLNLRTSTREKFVCWLFSRSDNLDAPRYKTEAEIGVRHETINKVLGAIKNDKRTVNIMKNHGLMDVEELERQNEWSVEMMEQKYNMPKNKGINEGYEEQFKTTVKTRKI